MPKNPDAWSSWNYLAQSFVDDAGVHRSHYDAVSWWVFLITTDKVFADLFSVHVSVGRISDERLADP